MKKIALLIAGLLICGVAFAATETINWYMDGNTYATTTCQTGGDIILPTTPYKYGYTFQGWAAYIPIEYIESTGTQYIDTGHIPTSGTRTEIDLRFAGPFNANNVNFYGVVDLVNNGIYAANFGATGQQEYEIFNWLCKNGTSGCSERPLSINANLKTTRQTYVLDAHNNTASYGNVQKNLSQKVSHPSASTYLFAAHRIETNGAETAFIYSATTSMFVYEIRIYEFGDLVHKFIPVLDKDGTPCMYDKVSQTFFYNSGTGDFIAGPVITE